MIGPPVLGCLDVFGLPLLSPAGQQKDNVFTVISEIHSVSRAIIDFILVNPAAHTFDVRGIAILKPCDSRCTLGGRFGVQVEKPFTEQVLINAIGIFYDFVWHGYW